MKWYYKKRWLAGNLREAAEFSPVVVLTGARQTGKSTLLRREKPFKRWRYLNLDDIDLLEIAEKSPDELVMTDEPTIIDEVQRSRKLFLSVKRAVDQDRNRRFILSGSANLLLMRHVTENLAGRALYFDLLPLACREDHGKTFPRWLTQFPEKKPPGVRISEARELDFLLVRGFMPPVTFLEKLEQATQWWGGYIKTYLERDMRQFSTVTNLVDFRKVMALAAARHGQVLVQSEMARDAGMSPATLGRYLNLLEVSGLFTKLHPYSRNISKRIMKSPKIYFIDPGLACALAGCRHVEQVSPGFKGALFEGLVFTSLRAFAQRVRGNLYYMRTQGGKEKEVDFILEFDGKRVGIEARCASRVGFHDARSIAEIKKIIPDLTVAIIVYTGDQTVRLTRTTFAVPYYAI